MSSKREAQSHASVIGSHIHCREWPEAVQAVLRALGIFKPSDDGSLDDYVKNVYYHATAVAELLADEELAKSCYGVLGYDDLPDVDEIPPETIAVIRRKAMRYLHCLGSNQTERQRVIFLHILEIQSTA